MEEQSEEPVGLSGDDDSPVVSIEALQALAFHAAKELREDLVDQSPNVEVSTPSESDFHGCGGTFIPRSDGRPGRWCGFCLTPAPAPRVRVLTPDGRAEWVPVAELLQEQATS